MYFYVTLPSLPLLTYLDVHQNIIQCPSRHRLRPLRGVLAVEPERGVSKVEVGQDVGISPRQGLGEFDLPTHSQGKIRSNSKGSGEATKLRKTQDGKYLRDVCLVFKRFIKFRSRQTHGACMRQEKGREGQGERRP